METEEEQVEKLKRWLKDNGISIVAGIVIGIGGLGGYRYWLEVQETEAQQASSHFTQMLEALSANNRVDVQSHAQTLINEYASTEYALMARLAIAKDSVASAEFEKALGELQEVVGSAGDKPLAYLARVRLATVQLQLDQYDQALSTLTVEFPQQFIAAVEELRGDVFFHQGKTDEAKQAYEKAQQAKPGPANAKYLQQKVDDLGATG